MTIAQFTIMQAYQLNKGGTRARMAILRMIAADSANNFNPHTRLQPGDWRKARNYTLTNYESAFCTISQGFNDEGSHKKPVWYCHTGNCFRDERDACDVVRMPYTGWHTDDHQEDSAIGIVGRLTHGRFIAGYWQTDSGERVYFDEVFSDESDAARMADEHARVFAETAREDNAKFTAARELETDIEDQLQRLRECLVLRHKVCMAHVRDEIAELCADIRRSRETLRTDYANHI